MSQTPTPPPPPPVYPGPGGALPPTFNSESLPYGVYEAPRSGLAIWSLILGIFSLAPCVVTAIPGLLAAALGVVSLSKIKSQPQRYAGRGMAIAGLCLGLLGVVLVPVEIAMMFPAMKKAFSLAKQQVTVVTLHSLGTSLSNYAKGNNNAYPPNLLLLVNDGSISKEELQDVNEGAPNPCDFFYAEGLSSSDPGDWPLVWSDPGYYGGKGAPMLYINGKADFVSEPKFSAEIERFKAEYQEKHASAPTIDAPHR